MRAANPYPLRLVFICLFFLAQTPSIFSQGRVVINEYMPWTSNTCGGPTAEFIELLNFGPGPVNIGCYIVTDGDFAVTIPPNTIIQAGQFFVLSGQNVIAAPCANIDSTVHTHLNWNTCNCTSGIIPATGDGWLTDGGAANEQVVLLDPNLNVIDAVARSLPVEPSSTITTFLAGGQCTAKTFNLDSMNINYETIGESAGRGNSFARKLDGDCGWVKDPQQSANATNNTSGDVSDVKYNFFITKAQTCSNDGSVAVTVTAPDMSVVFPMSYILAFDSNGDGIFSAIDTYTYGTVTNPNTVFVSNLAPGTYRLTIASVKGCFLHTFPFTILDCFPVLPVRLISFGVTRTDNTLSCRWSIAHAENISRVIIEASVTGQDFKEIRTVQYDSSYNENWSYNTSIPTIAETYFRIRIETKNGQQIISSVIHLNSASFTINKLWPNPVKDQLFGEAYFNRGGVADYHIYNLNNQVLSKGRISIQQGINSFTIPIHSMPSGSYYLVIENKPANEIIRLSFLKL
jgi:hypothetical protein